MNQNKDKQIPDSRNNTKNETKRLNALLDYQILDTPPQAELDCITQLASRICGTPIALISLIDAKRQWFMSNVGLDASETARDIAFCDHAIQQTDIFEINDATKDARFADNPLVTEDPSIRFYAGAPLVTPDGDAIGTLCAIDSKPNALDDVQRAALESLSMQIMTRLELQKSYRLLKDAYELQSLINENNSSPIFVKDKDCKLVYANKALKSLYPPNMRSSLLGSTTAEQFSEEDAEAFLAEDKKALAEGLSLKVEQLTMPNGKLLTLKTMKKRFVNSDGETFLLGISDDISERETLINKLVWSHQDLEKFIKSVERELINPIEAIEAITGWLRDDLQTSLQANDIEHFDLLAKRINRMKALLFALEKYRSIEKLDTTTKVLTPQALLSSFKAMNDAGRKKIKCSGDNVTVPYEAANQAVAELIKNAYEHNQNQTIVVDITCVANEHGSSILVKDNGKGIPSTAHKRIFEFGETIKAKDEHESSGVGLAIVKQLLTKTGGTASVSHEPGNGVTFCLQWPYVEEQEGELD